MPASRQPGDSDFLSHLRLLGLTVSQLRLIESRKVWINQQLDPAKERIRVLPTVAAAPKMGKGLGEGTIGMAEIVAGPVRVYLEPFPFEDQKG
jgi:hypothetical protein